VTKHGSGQWLYFKWLIVIAEQMVDPNLCDRIALCCPLWSRSIAMSFAGPWPLFVIGQFAQNNHWQCTRVDSMVHLSNLDYG
jgi:hypothetical protein